MAGFFWLASPGVIERINDALDRDLIAYFARYTGFPLADLDRTPIARLRRIADGVSAIIEEENKPSTKE